ncbi:MAG: twin-arginine translocase TatA/TatE family subunit [Muribaculaceae bacterium]|nr:twin-arginine translocase TatA/TatE family subunit [Muribaculaceae bacterium]
MTLTMITAMIMGYQWLIILLIVLLLFGGKKIPELMKGVGKGVRAFKEGMNEAEGELKKAMDEPAKKTESAAKNDGETAK